MIPLWNAYYFFTLYANAADHGAGYEAKFDAGSTDVLDRYILAKTAEFVQRLTGELDALNVAAACDATRGFLEVLSNWYIRRSRDRFWDGDSAEAHQAFDTLYTVLEVVNRAVAPLLPLTTEEIFRGLTGARSVHLTDWPEADSLPSDPELVAVMDRAREVCSAVSALRKSENLRVRLPLSKLTVVTDEAGRLAPFAELISDELNVRELELTELAAVGDGALGVTQVLQVNARAAGPRLGRDVQRAIKASKSGDWSVADDGTVTAGGIALVEGEYTLQTVVADADPAERRAVTMLASGGFAVLDTAVTPELAAEGLARDVVRVVQQSRREAGLQVSDRIRLTLGGAPDVLAALETHRDLVSAETLTEELSLAPASGDASTSVGEGQRVTVELSRV
jgi:isoleucyl-tRNA synthetase